MRKIVPFNNILTFDTDVNKITAISLEHELNKDVDAINGVFYINGEYKMLNGGLNQEKFNFELPFDIALSNRYQMDSLIVDIDDFRYELIDENKMKVNIDLYIDGEVVEEKQQEMSNNLLSELDDERMEQTCEKDTVFSDVSLTDDLGERMDDLNEEVVIAEQINDSENIEVIETMEEEIKRESEIVKEVIYEDENKLFEESEKGEINNVLNNVNDEESYVTYMVYRVVDGDTIDNILAKYKITKEELLSYNENVTDIRVGDKLIIPAK